MVQVPRWVMRREGDMGGRMARSMVALPPVRPSTLKEEVEQM
jgi:hypothetical protein